MEAVLFSNIPKKEKKEESQSIAPARPESPTHLLALERKSAIRQDFAMKQLERNDVSDPETTAPFPHNDDSDSENREETTSLLEEDVTSLDSNIVEKPNADRDGQERAQEELPLASAASQNSEPMPLESDAATIIAPFPSLPDTEALPEKKKKRRPPHAQAVPVIEQLESQAALEALAADDQHEPRSISEAAGDQREVSNASNAMAAQDQSASSSALEAATAEVRLPASDPPVTSAIVPDPVAERARAFWEEVRLRQGQEFVEALATLLKENNEIAVAAVITTEGYILAHEWSVNHAPVDDETFHEKAVAVALALVALRKTAACSVMPEELSELSLESWERATMLFDAGNKGVLVIAVHSRGNLGMTILDAREAAQRIGSLLAAFHPEFAIGDGSADAIEHNAA